MTIPFCCALVDIIKKQYLTCLLIIAILKCDKPLVWAFGILILLQNTSSYNVMCLKKQKSEQQQIPIA